MEKRIQGQFVYEGFGFPVVLKNVPMVKVRGAWTPDVDYNALSKGVLRAIATHQDRLTGGEVRFVRHYFEMTLQQFAERFGVSHPAVLKWEKAGAGVANMTWGIEKDLRLFILDSMGAKPKTLAETYRMLARPPRVTSRRIVLDAVA
jgi:DNA-binding XRE family transcriptional regulator